MGEVFVITVSGACSKAGKTQLIEKLLPALADCAAVKVQAHGDVAFSVATEDSPLQSPGKDTARYLAAGARRAFLIRGSFEQARTAVEEIVKSGQFDTVVVESNRVSIEMESDLSFFVQGAGERKESADICEERADVIVSAISSKERVCPCPTSKKKNSLPS